MAAWRACWAIARRRTGAAQLNPLRHVDPVGTVFLPGMLALAHAPVFGLAKPVPVDVRGLPHPRRAMMIVGAAGPAMNFVLAAVAAVGIGILARIEPGAGAVAQFVFDNLVNFLVINLSLACFNLLPLPPFDGSHIVEGLLPERAANAYARLRPLGFPIILVLLVVLPWLMPAIDPVQALLVPPVSWLGEHCQLSRALWPAARSTPEYIFSLVVNCRAGLIAWRACPCRWYDISGKEQTDDP
jgi:Zn-dependent protease